MPWIVKLDKENDWIGRYSIEWYQRRGDRFALVGFEGQNGSVPKEGAQVVGDGGMPVGRVTSSRFSRRLGQVDRHRLGAGRELPRRGRPSRSPTRRARRSRRASRRSAFYDPDRSAAAVVSAVDPYAFLSPAAAARRRRACARRWSARHIAAGATIEERDGWRIGVYPDDGDGDPWVVDVSHLGKLDLRATAAGLDELTGGLAPGEARADGGVWTLRLTPTHGYVLCPFDRVEAIRARDRRRRDRRHLRPGRRSRWAASAGAT